MMTIRVNPSRVFAFFGFAAATAAVVLASAGLAHAQAGLTIVYSFEAQGDGGFPTAGLVQGSDGMLYGTTFAGGLGEGTVFQLAPDGSTYMVLHIFDPDTDPGTPNAALIQTSDGTLYGTTIAPSAVNGTIFQIAPDGSNYAVLHTFSGPDGSAPQGALVQGGDGMFYGVTYQGGNFGMGTIYQMAPDGTGFTVLHSFGGGGGNGLRPRGLIQGNDGMLYGTTEAGGGTGLGGTVFQLAPDGRAFTTLHRFTNAEGCSPRAGVIQGSDGSLYGTTVGCTSRDGGTVFRMALDGSGFSTLHNLIFGTDGSEPNPELLMASDGMLYGTTFRGGSHLHGTIFQCAPDGSGFAVLYSFTGVQSDGDSPAAGLIQGSDGALYGTTFFGGNGLGVVFQLTLPLSLDGQRAISKARLQ